MIREKLWKELVALARQRHQKAVALVEQVLRDYVQRVADEDLLSRSACAARQTRFRMQETEAIVKKSRDSRKRG